MFTYHLLETKRSNPPAPHGHNPGPHQWKESLRQQVQRRRSSPRTPSPRKAEAPSISALSSLHKHQSTPQKMALLDFPKNSLAISTPDKSKRRRVAKPGCPRFGRPEPKSMHSSKNTESSREISSRPEFCEGASSDPHRLQECMSPWVIALANEKWVMSLGHFTWELSQAAKKTKLCRKATGRPHQRQDTSFTS